MKVPGIFVVMSFFFKIKAGLVYIRLWGGVWWVHKLEQLQEIYFQSKKNLANVLPEKKCIVIEVLLLIITLRYTVWVAKNKIFRIKIIEHTCKFMTIK